MRELALLALVALTLPGCTPRIGNGQLTCAVNGGRCPSGFHCALDLTCWRDGEDPTFAADGGLGKPNGQGCGGADECRSGFCAGQPGVCCDSACDGVCETCAGTTPGRCTLVRGQPTGGRTCGGDTSGACVGTCDGSARDCVYPSASIACGADCASSCDGMGRCPGGGLACPGGYACGPGGCRASCLAPSDCQPQFDCVNGACTRAGESDCFDGIDNNGDALADCADPTCAPFAACVDAPAVGETVGKLSTDGTCAPGYGGATLPLHQTLSSPPCSGCSCSATVECTYVLSFFTDSAACSTVPRSPLGLRVFYPGRCSPIVNTSSSLGSGMIRSVRVDHDSPAFFTTCQETTVGPLSKPTPTWATSEQFCARPASPATGCPGAQLCVPRSACLLRPGLAPCGTSFTSSNGAWYTDYADGRSCGCGACSVSGVSCPDQLPVVNGYSTDTTCSAGPSAHFEGLSTLACNPYNLGDAYWGDSLAAAKTSNGPSAAACTIPTLTTGAATPTGAHTICCQ